MRLYSKGLTAKTALSILSLILLTGFLQAQTLEKTAGQNVNGEDLLTIVAVGDIMMGSTYPSNMLPPDDGKNIFNGVKVKLQQGDVILGNLEGPLIDNCAPKKCTKGKQQCFEFVTPVRYVNYLKEAGFNIVNIANNHTFDCGLPGVDNTINILKSNGIEPTGGETLGRLQIKGKHIVIIGFSFTLSDHAYSINDIDMAQEIIKKLKEENDIVIVSFHGGGEGKSALHTFNTNEKFLGEKRGNVMQFSRAAIDAGADLVLGHGPHVLRAMEVYKSKLIAYSLGNFLTYKLFNMKGVNSLSAILTIKINAQTGAFMEGAVIPVKLSKHGIPEIDPRGEATKLLKRITATDIRGNILEINEETGVLSLTP
jgi:poly-gamma-glutamate capsule biosynthesis protein CapA/YwtB (metallophosphatase superfamily)